MADNPMLSRGLKTRLGQKLYAGIKARPKVYRIARSSAFALRRLRSRVGSIGSREISIFGDSDVQSWTIDLPVGVVRADIAIDRESAGRNLDTGIDTGGPWVVAELEHPTLFDSETLVTSAGELVSGALEPSGEFLAISPRVWNSPSGRLGGRSLILACRDGRGYFHWLYDVLPRLELAERAGWKLDEFDHFVVNGYYARYQVRTLERFGIGPDRVVSVLSKDRIQPESAVVTTHPRQASEIPRWLIDFLRDRFLVGAESPTAECIYLTRARTHHGRPAHEDLLEAELRRRGFVVPVLEQMSLEEKATLFEGVRTVVGPTGAGFGHLAFAEPGTNVIELDVRGMPFVELPNLCQTLGMNYARVERDRSGVVPIRGVIEALDAVGVGRGPGR